MNPTKFFMNICELNLTYFTSILQKIGSKSFGRICPTKLHISIKSNKNVRCASYKYLNFQILVNPCLYLLVG
jgi:hypothetical protein